MCFSLVSGVIPASAFEGTWDPAGEFQGEDSVYDGAWSQDENGAFFTDDGMPANKDGAVWSEKAPEDEFGSEDSKEEWEEDSKAEWEEDSFNGDEPEGNDDRDVFEFRFMKSDTEDDNASLAIEGPGVFLSMPLTFYTKEEDVLVLSEQYLNSCMKLRWTEGGDKTIGEMFPDEILMDLMAFDTAGSFVTFQLTSEYDGEVKGSYVLFIIRIDGDDILKYVLIEDRSGLDADAYLDLMEEYSADGKLFKGTMFAQPEDIAEYLKAFRENMRLLYIGEEKEDGVADFDFDLMDRQPDDIKAEEVDSDAILPEGSREETDDGSEDEQADNQNDGLDENEVQWQDEPFNDDEQQGEVLPGFEGEDNGLEEGSSSEETAQQEGFEINDDFVGMMLELQNSDVERYEEILESMTDDEYDLFWRMAYGEAGESEQKEEEFDPADPKNEPDEQQQNEDIDNVDSSDGINAEDGDEDGIAEDKQEENVREDLDALAGDSQEGESADDEGDEILPEGEDKTNNSGIFDEEGNNNDLPPLNDSQDEDGILEDNEYMEDESSSTNESEANNELSDELNEDGEEKLVAEEEEAEEPEEPEEAEGEDKEETDEEQEEKKEEDEIDIELPKETEVDETVEDEKEQDGEEDYTPDDKTGVDLFKDEELTEQTRGLTMSGMRAAPMMKLGGFRSTSQKLLSSDDIAANTYENVPPEFTPVSQDGLTLKNVAMRWVSKSTGSTEKAGFGTLWLEPDEDIVPNQQWQINFEMEGIGYLDAGAVELVIPAYIWKDKDGNEPGLLTLAVPEEPSTAGTFAWKRVGDTVVVTNVRAISAGSSYMVQGTFRMTYPDPNANKPFTSTYAHQMVDIDVTVNQNNINDYTGRGINTGISDDFYCALNIVTPINGEILTAESNHINAMLNTYVAPDSVAESVVGDAVLTSQPSDLPASFAAKLSEVAAANGMSTNLDDYFYVQWYLGGKVRGGQSFDMDTNEMVSRTAYKISSGAGEEEISVNAMLLGLSYTADGDVVNEDPLGTTDMTANLYDGYSNKEKSMYAWVAYPKTDFPEGYVYRLSNSHTITVTGQDDEISQESEVATATITFRQPITWKINVIWDDDNNAAGRRPSSILSFIDNTTLDKRSYTYTLTAADAVAGDSNMWHTEWTDDGTVCDYEGYEYSYPVTQNHLTFLSGTESQPVVYNDGHTERVVWSYRHVESAYDEPTHTWTFRNQYSRHVVPSWYKLMSLSKSASGHSDNKVTSTDDKDLQLLRNGRETTEINYNVSTDSFLLEYTVADGGDPQNEADLAQRNVRLEIVDYAQYLNTRLLGSDDIKITYIDVNEPQYYRWAPNSDASTGSYSLVAQNGSQGSAYTYTAYIYGLPDGEENWVMYGSVTNGVLTVENGATSSGMKLYFPAEANVRQVKEAVTTNMARVSFGFKMHTKVLPSEANMAAVETAFSVSDYAIMTMQNNAKLYAFKNPGTASEAQISPAVQSTARSYLHGRNYRMAADMEKLTSFISTDSITGMIRIDNAMVVRQQSNIAFKADFLDAIRDDEIHVSQSGTFYDLLPPGMQADMDSVKIDYGTVENVNIIENYRNSGRQMLIVKATLDSNYYYQRSNSSVRPHPTDQSYPQEGWAQSNALSFTMYYPIAEEAMRGPEYRNNSAYFADENVFANLADWLGEPDDPSAGYNKTSMTAAGIWAEDRALMTNLDPDRDTPSVIYAGASGTITEIDIEALNYLVKKAQVVGSSSWSFGYNDEIVVYEGGHYSYQLNETHISDAATASAAKDIILLDSLENHILESTDPGYSADGQWAWQGTLQSVDVSAIIDMGADPVIYYSTVPALDLSSYYREGQSANTVKNKLADTSVWSTTAPDDLSTVTAVAIDCSKKIDGTDFLLYDQESLIAYIHMKAPVAETGKGFRVDAGGARTNTVGDVFDPMGNYDDQANNAHAYNKGYVDLTDVALTAENEPGSTLQHHYIPSGNTRVGIQSFDVDIVKEWRDQNDNDGYRPEEVYLYLMLDDQPANRYGEQAANASELAYLRLEGETNMWGGTLKHVRLYDNENMRIYYTLQESSLEPEQFWTEWNWTDEEREANTSSEALWISKYEQDIERDLTSIRLINIHELDTVDITMSKEWTSDEPPGWERYIPSFITVKLFADGEATGKTARIQPDAEGNWEGQFLDLQAKKNKVDIVYTIEETEVKNFVTTQETVEGTVVFTNRYYPYGDLKINEKIIDGTQAAIDNAEFTFTLVLTKESGGETVPVTGKYNYWIIDESDNGEYDEENPDGKIGNGDEFKLKDGQSIIVEAIPSDTNYAVTQDELQGFSLVSSQGSTGVIKSGKGAEGTFINKYTTEGTISFRVAKELAGTALKRYQFVFSVFDLTDVYQDELGTENAEPKELRRASNNAEGVVQFGQIRFGNPDDGIKHVYLVRESLANRKDGYVYDESKYYAEVVPSDNGDGSMTAEAHWYKYTPAEEISAPMWIPTQNYFRESNDADEIAQASAVYTREEIDAAEVIFRNAYEAEGAMTLRAWKVMTQRQVAEGEFEFALIYSGVKLRGESEFMTPDDNVGRLIDTARNDSTGTVVFKEIRFTEQDIGKTFYYTIREVNGDDPTVIYDESLYGYSVEVVDNGDGTLSFNQALVDTEGMWTDCQDCGGAGIIEDESQESQIAHVLVVRSQNSVSAGPGQDTLAFTLRWGDYINDDIAEIFFMKEDTIMGYTRVNGNNSASLSADVQQEDKSEYKVRLKTANWLGEVSIGTLEDIPGSGLGCEFAMNGHQHAACATCSGSGLIRDNSWSESTHLMDVTFSLDGLTLGITSSGVFTEASTEAQESGKITWIASAVTAVNGDNTTPVVFALDQSYNVSDSIMTDGETDAIFGSGASVEFASGYTGKLAVPTYEELLENSVTVSVYGTKAQLPVFRNKLRDGSLSITKDSLTNLSAHKEDKFHFRVKLIGDDIDNGELSYALEKAEEYPKAITITYKTLSYGEFVDGTTEKIMTYRWNGFSYDNVDGTELTDPVGYNGFAFNGWTDIGGAPYVFDETQEQESAVVYADWSKNITITYDANGNSWQNTEESVVNVDYKWDMAAARWVIVSGTIPTLPSSSVVVDANGFRIVTTVNGLFTAPSGGSAFEDISPENTAESSRTAYLSITVTVAPDVKYAVSPYAIGKGQDINGATLGITFGPALGANYFNSYKSHEPTDTTASGNAHRCVHNDTWEEIVYWNNEDPYVYEQCVTEKCTHTIPLYLDSAIKGSNFSLGYSLITGDGASVIWSEMKANARVWNGYYNGSNYTTWYNTDGGWGACNMRAVLNGVQPETSNGTDVYDPDNPTNGVGVVWAVNAGITEETSVFGAFPDILKDNIAQKKISSTIFDKLWILSVPEISESGRYSRFPSGTNSAAARVGYRAKSQSGTGAFTTGADTWNTRTCSDGFVRMVNSPGYCYGGAPSNTDSRGYAPCFALATTYVSD